MKNIRKNGPSRRTNNFSFERLEPRRVLTTLLVNFDNGNAIVNPASAQDFADANAGVDLAAQVNEVATFQGTSTIAGTDGLSASITVNSNFFPTPTGTYANTPILDSYLFNNSTTAFQTVTVASLEEFEAGSVVTVFLHGVGDGANQDTEFRARYNGVNLGLQESDYEGTIDDTFVSYSFTKVAGVNSVQLDFRNAGNGGGAGGFGGFSITDGARQPLRINAGGGQHVDAQGNRFLADQFSSGGTAFTTDDDIFIVGTGTNINDDSDVDDILYQSERFGEDLVYEIPVANGIYDLRLHFAEIFFQAENQRVFDVTVEGVNILNDFDIFGTRMNAFTPGHDASLPLDFNEIQVTDGFLSLNIESLGADGIDNAKISAIEVLPVEGPSIALLSSGGSTIVAEGGQTDTISVALTEAPTSNVSVQLLLGEELSADIQTLVFTPANFSVPQTVTITAIDDSDGEGQQSVALEAVASSADPVYDGITRTLDVTVVDDDLVPVEFDVRTLATFSNPVAGAFGPDGRLYAANQFGLIQAYTFDNDYNVISTENITTISNLPDGGNTLGIAFNPFEQVAPGETPTLYVSQSFLFRGTNDFESSVLTLSGPNHSVLTEIVTGLPVSGFDHGVNGLQFDGEGDLLIAIGGNTNTGEFDGVFGSQAPESPLTSAILRARISDPNFNGNIQYQFIDPTDPDLIDLAIDEELLPPGATTAAGLDPNDQRFGEFLQVLDVAGEIEVETFAVGLRNAYDLVYTTEGSIFATDNGPNGIAEDELNLIEEGGFFGHPSIPRGRLDPRQTLDNAEYDPNAPSTDDFTTPLTALQSSTNGIDEFRSEVFGGQLQGQLIAQRFNNEVFFFQLDDAGTALENINTFEIGEVADGLDIVTGPGGVIFGIDRNQSRITIAEPVDNNVVSSTAYDIFPFRAPAVGGNQFVIGGTNFGDINDTTVLIDGFEAELISVENNRIVGIFPTVPASTVLRDVTVISDQEVTVLDGSFLPLGEGLDLVAGRNVFYNDSAFDDNDAGATAADDNAIAIDKVALLPGQTATFENYTSFDKGINGIIIDVHLNDPDAFSSDDITLATGAGNLLSDFTTLGVNVDVSVRVGEGVDGADRITVILPNESVVNEYLQVSVLANDTTGLSENDVFYFGNIIGETGDLAGNTIVGGLDISSVSANLTGFGSENVDNPFDINRDSLVSGLDISVISANLTGFTPVPLITAPTGNSSTAVLSVQTILDEPSPAADQDSQGEPPLGVSVATTSFDSAPVTTTAPAAVTGPALSGLIETSTVQIIPALTTSGETAPLTVSDSTPVSTQPEESTSVPLETRPNTSSQANPAPETQTTDFSALRFHAEFEPTAELRSAFGFDFNSDLPVIEKRSKLYGVDVKLEDFDVSLTNPAFSEPILRNRDRDDIFGDDFFSDDFEDSIDSKFVSSFPRVAGKI